MPRVSIISPVFNHERYVGQAIQSALDQTFTDFELIVVNDGSEDGTLEEIRKFNDPRLKVFSLDANMGPTTAINLGLTHATGDLVAMLDSDDAYYPFKLERQVAYMDAHPETLAITSRPHLMDADGMPLAGDHPFAGVFTSQNRSRHEWLREFFLKGNCLCHPSMMTRREVYTRVGNYQPMFYQLGDFNQWVRIVLRGEIHVMSEPMIRYRVHAGNLSAPTPRTIRRCEVETNWILRNYLHREALENLGSIFGPEWQGIRDPVEAIVALASIAQRTGRPPYQLFASQILLEASVSGPLRDEIHVRMRDLFVSLDGFRTEETIRLNEENGRLQNALHELESQKHALESEMAAAGRRAVKSSHRLASMETSLSWKVTQPLRALSGLISRR